jgi:hypothetical protein
MTYEEFKAQHPELFKAVHDEGYSAGKAQGIIDGKGQAEASVSVAKAEGAKLERERIQGIESLSFAGVEKIISDAKFDPAATKESVAILISENQKQIIDKVRTNREADASALAEQARKLGTGGAGEPADADEQIAVGIAAAAAKLY